MSATRPDINIHPTTYSTSTIKTHNWDVLIIGCGPTGFTAAIRCASANLSVLIIENEIAGGECQNWGCVPSKALLNSLEVAGDVQVIGGTRERLQATTSQAAENTPKVDLEGLWSFRDNSTFNWVDDGSVSLLASCGVSLVHGTASFVAPHKVSVANYHTQQSITLHGNSIIICTGSEPIIPSIPGLAQTNYWTPREAVSAREVPKHLIVLGAGPLGTEFATIYAQLGSRVTLICNKPRILPNVHEEASSRVTKNLLALGVDIKNDAKVASIEPSHDHTSITVAYTDSTTTTGTHILVAAGRTQRTHSLNLSALGSIPSGVPIKVDAQMHAVAISEGWLYAIGDTNGISNTTHMGMYEATICAQHIISSHTKAPMPKGTDRVPENLRDVIPQTVFTSPQISYVGLSLATASARGIKARAISVETGGPGTHSYLYGENYSGWAQWIIEISTGKILGATFVGNGVANLLHASTTAIVGGMTWMQMVHVVPSFPTLSEVYHLLGQGCLGERWE